MNRDKITMRARVGRSLRRWVGWDVPIILAACVLTILAGSRFDIIERFYDYTRAHDDWELDEFALVFVTLSVAGFVLSARRYAQIRKEFNKRLEAERQMRFLALNDPLTGLANRRAFIKRLRQVVTSVQSAEYAVAMMDLDRFKPINDLHGHATGDRFLQTVSERLQDELKPGEILARLGGDEFAAILCDTSGDDQLDRVVAKMLRAVEQPAEIGNVVCQVGVSAGIAVVRPGCTLSVEQVLKQADMALYDAKENGRGRHVYFDEQMNAKAVERSVLEIDLRKAVRTGQIRPHYQPLVRLSDGALEGYEILARWHHPSQGIVMPDRFIPIAEDTGLIGEMTLNLLRAVCESEQDWPDGLFVSLNISPVQLRHEDIVDDLLGVLREFDMPPQFLEVEITENALIHDVETAEFILRRMSAEGIRLALDDFGTGYSSLHQLRS
ncbi:MAG: diguanylate cyclase, partial [Henriciella sp.]|uniref:putative bifunctional diguanylate cyclase/phosphodiesterase n=1 Tax=Henriciella sp. TaxID=1968823 RepID=UPI003C72D610